MLGSPRVLLAACLLSHVARKSWSFAPPLAKKVDVAPSSTALNLFRRSRLRARSVAQRTDDFDCSSSVEPSVSLPLDKQAGLAEMLRSAVVTDYHGKNVRLGEKMGDGRSVVVFLRHLGDPYCWSYARDWGKLQRKVRRNGAVGPLFVSVGDSEKLKRFLELNRNIPRDQAFVDDNSVQAYESIGLASMELGKELPEGVEVGAPNLGGVLGWWKYMRNVMDLSPVEPGARTFSEGFKQLGGTFIIDGNDVIYEWNDRCPGDTPMPDDVMDALRLAP